MANYIKAEGRAMAGEANGNSDKIQDLERLISYHISCLQFLPPENFDAHFPEFANIALSGRYAEDRRIQVISAIIGPETIPAPYTGESFRQNLARLMDEYAVACIEDGEFFRRWHRMLGQIGTLSQPAAAVVLGGFTDYKGAEAAGSPPHVNTERIAMKIGSSLRVLGLKDEQMAAVSERFGLDEEKIEEEVIRDMEEFASQASRAGLFEKKWAMIMNLVASENPELAGEAARRILTPNSPGYLESVSGLTEACNMAARISTFLVQKGFYYKAAEVADSLRSFVRQADWGPEATAAVQTQMNFVMDSWRQHIDQKPDGELKDYARGVFEEFQARISENGTSDPAPAPVPPPPKFDGLA